MSKTNQKIRELNLENLAKARGVAFKNRIIRRQEYFAKITKDNSILTPLLESKGVSKIALAMLYLAEGSKRERGCVVFGNSDPYVIKLFLHLLRSCYKLDETKFRCTVQCRADQDISQLQTFWSETTRIPLNKFCKAQVDKRSIGKPTKKISYKGVCRIDYFSASIFHEILIIPKIIYRGL